MVKASGENAPIGKAAKPGTLRPDATTLDVGGLNPPKGKGKRSNKAGARKSDPNRRKRNKGRS